MGGGNKRANLQAGQLRKGDNSGLSSLAADKPGRDTQEAVIFRHLRDCHLPVTAPALSPLRKLHEPWRGTRSLYARKTGGQIGSLATFIPKSKSIMSLTNA